MKLKFLNFFKPEDINKLCKDYKVKVTIEAISRENNIVFNRVPIEFPPGSGNMIIKTVEEKWEQIELQSTREIRSWNDLFSYDNKHAIYLDKKEKQSLK